jgi:hypothetical protein
VGRNEFGGQWEPSGKQHDLGMKVRDSAGDYTLKWVLKIGLSETYEKLKDDVRLWLEGSDEVSMVKLIKIHETPRYDCPIPIDQDPEQLGIPSNKQEIIQGDIILGGQLGPATYKRKRDGGKREPQQKQNNNGNRTTTETERQRKQNDHSNRTTTEIERQQK